MLEMHVSPVVLQGEVAGRAIGECCSKGGIQVQGSGVRIHSACMVAAAGQLVPFVLHVQRLRLTDISCIRILLGRFLLLNCPALTIQLLGSAEAALKNAVFPK